MTLTVRGLGMSLAGLRASEDAAARGLSRISSGFRITGAADDAAGLAISQRMRSQVTGSAMAMRNVQDGINMVQTAEGGLSGMTAMLQRARELAVQAASSGTMTADDRAAAAAEVRQLVSEIDRTARATSFNGQRMLDGSRTGGFTFQVGASGGDTLGVSSYDLTAGALHLLGAGVSTLSTGTSQPTWSTTSATGFLARYNDSTRPNKTDFQFALDGVDAGTATLAATRYTTEADLVSALNTDLSSKGIAVTAVLVDAGTSRARIAFSAAAATSQITVTKQGSDVLGVTTVQEPAEGAPTVSAFSFTSTAALVDLVSAGSAEAIVSCDEALTALLTVRSELGATQNRMEHRLSVLATSGENLDSARSRIEDADIAKEYAGLVRAQLLTQAGTAMQAQGAQSGQRVLQLLGSL